MAKRKLKRRSRDVPLDLVGKTVKDVFSLHPKELGWEEDFYLGWPVIIEFTDGTMIWCRADSEANTYGCFSWATVNDKGDLKDSGAICCNKEHEVKVLCGV